MLFQIHPMIDLMEVVLKIAVMKFHNDFFKKKLGIIMGTNVASILAHTHMYLWIHISEWQC